VALARALATNPSLLLLDEPLSALDARVRVHLRREIRSLQHRLGVTTVMVTHDQEEALTMADRVVVMEGGRLVQEGPPRAVYQAPADTFVAGFVGSMNFLPARMAEGGRVMLGGTTLSATGAAAATPGSPVTVAVRPEDIHLATGETNGNALHGRVLSVEFRGPVYRLHVALDPAGETQVEVDVRRGMVEAGDLAEDARVALHIPPEGLMVFPAEAATVSGAAD
jgi:iron(III) transport system ATP-binding protein